MTTLDEAWAAAEAVMPEGGRPSVYFAGWGKWGASFSREFTECARCGTVHQCPGEDDVHISEFGDSPAEALLALAHRLRRRG